MSVIEVKNLTKDYGFHRGVFNISFSIEKGEVFGFLGPNGAGKSTTIRHLMGFSKPDKGNTYIFNKETFKKYYEILNKVGYIPGEIALPQGLTGLEFIRMIQSLQKIKNEKRLRELIRIFELDSAVLKGETKWMSLGEKRKLAIITAFMSDPEVLILDEPTSGLDPVMQEKFIQFIKEEKKRGKTILLSSHIFSEVDATCDRIAIIKDGEIVSEFLANDLKHATQKSYKIYFFEKKGYNDFLNSTKNRKYIKVIEKNEDEICAFISINDSNIDKLISLLSKYEIKEFVNIKETLEDYFMKFYKEETDFGGING